MVAVSGMVLVESLYESLRQGTWIVRCLLDFVVYIV
jgi:hypothetical protein